jgi:hypothetical protein
MRGTRSEFPIFSLYRVLGQGTALVETLIRNPVRSNPEEKIWSPA